LIVSCHETYSLSYARFFAYNEDSAGNVAESISTIQSGDSFTVRHLKCYLRVMVGIMVGWKIEPTHVALPSRDDPRWRAKDSGCLDNPRAQPCSHSRTTRYTLRQNRVHGRDASLVTKHVVAQVSLTIDGEGYVTPEQN